MPRLDTEPHEALQAEYDQWAKETGNGSSTFDLCWGCANAFADMQLNLIATHHGKNLSVYNGEPAGIYFLVLDGDGVEHPPYEDEDYYCEICGNLLEEADN